MNKRRTGLLMALLCLAALTALPAVPEAAAARKTSASAARSERAERKPLKPENFAHSITLTGESGAMLTMPLPESVYQGMRRQDHLDICVFDSQGLPTPFALTGLERENIVQESNIDLKFFPWRPASATGGTGGTGGKDEAEARLTPSAGDIEISSGGSIVRIKGQGAAPDNTPAPKPGLSASPSYYLVDMEQYLHLIASRAADAQQSLRNARLLLETAFDGDFTCYVSMQTSSNLNDWQQLGERQTITRVRHGENVLSRENISLPPGMQRYLLLKLEGEAIVPGKVSSNLEFGRYSSITAQRSVAGVISKDRRSVVYDLGGYFNIAALDFEQPGSEIVNVRLSSSNVPEQGWRFQGTHLLYRMFGDGESVSSEPIRLRSRDRYWRLDVRGDFPFAEAPLLKAHWHPAQLTFLARGQGPWTLAFGGNEAVEPSPMPATGIAQAREASIVEATPVEPGEQPSPELKEPEEQDQTVLWAVLIIGVAVLLGIALWLGRSMRKK